MSALNGNRDMHGMLWTTEHHQVEELFRLGLAFGKVQHVLPRRVWRCMKDKFPYYVINETSRITFLSVINKSKKRENNNKRYIKKSKHRAYRKTIR